MKTFEYSIIDNDKQVIGEVSIYESDSGWGMEYKHSQVGYMKKLYEILEEISSKHFSKFNLMKMKVEMEVNDNGYKLVKG